MNNLFSITDYWLIINSESDLIALLLLSALFSCEMLGTKSYPPMFLGRAAIDELLQQPKQNYLGMLKRLLSLRMQINTFLGI